MTGPPSISVRRQVLEADVQGTDADGLAVHRRLGDACRDVLPAALEAALGPVDPGDAHLTVDRLEIDVSIASLDRLEAELAEGVRRGVEEYLRRHPVAAAGRTPASGDVGRRTAAEAVDDALVAFLLTGRLPWWFTLPAGVALEERVLAAWRASDGGGARARADLIRAVLAEPAAGRRLVAQFTPGFVTAVLGLVAPGLATAAGRVVAALEDAPVPARVSASAAGRVWQVAVAAASAGVSGTPGGLATAVLAGIAPGDPHRAELIAALRHVDADAAASAGASGSPNRAGAPRPGRAVGASPDGPTGAPTPPVAGVGQAELGQGILVDHAGLVLLHPFLPSFLETLGVASAGRLTDPDRALCLLHLLATGERIAPEHRLTCAKALCGVPLDAVVASDLNLTDDEVDEADALLRAAIGHWETLRNTSPAGLRAEFLTRPGLLRLQPDGDFLLRVEPRTSDVLLQGLPWTISAFRLPWLDCLMWVEWG